ncbi:hypothetical protein TMCBR2_gp013 [Caulobacter phage TMCBR2]|uniref:Uncharacterized protein n=3 Tax=Kronosvirus TaxID=3425745 RepID=A0A386KPZ3_9CAUD|nr:hypothetical protein [Caulobacter phage Kronos]WCS66498.1 hypothetical protein TMCBR2_gp013 [Caulobacter phage TMCBR2]WDS38261.1 hypothetical protein TMCBR3_gp013 [Caulobacter phage TMCBR3]WDS38322.1 hypothetical protein TMCBR4_gp013 [Caulobacter phage TMCBR4]WDS38381.1 hypothetical protein W2_gp013 [Caulobacter phage W2]
MAKKEAQTQTVTIGGTVYPVRFDYGSLIAFCDEVGATIDTMQQALAALPLNRMSLVVWAGIVDWTYETDDDETGTPSMTPARVSRLLKGETIEDAQAILAKCLDAFTASMAPKRKEPAEGDTASPPATPAMTSPGSTDS